MESDFQFLTVGGPLASSMCRGSYFFFSLSNEGRSVEMYYSQVHRTWSRSVTL